MPTYNEYLKKLNHKRNFVDQHAIDVRRHNEKVNIENININKLADKNTQLMLTVNHEFDRLIKVYEKLTRYESIDRNYRIMKEAQARKAQREKEEAQREKENLQKKYRDQQKKRFEEEQKRKKYLIQLSIKISLICLGILVILSIFFLL